MTFLYLSSERRHFTSSVCLIEICERLCYYFWNCIGDLVNIGIIICSKNSNMRIRESRQFTHLMCNVVFLMINIAGAFRTQFHTDHSTYGLKEKQIIAIEKTHETNIYKKSHLIATTISSNTSMVDNFY